MNNKLIPAVIGGVAIALLVLLTSLISSVVRIASCCNCLWAIGGGLLAVYMYVKKSSAPMQLSEGAVLGAMAGAIGGLVYLIVGVPLSYVVNSGLVEEQLRQAGINLPISGFLLFLLGGILSAVLFAILATVGGLLGVKLFEKRMGGTGGMTPPPPPSNFGGPAPPSGGFGNQPGGGYGNQPQGGFGGQQQPGGFGSNPPGGSGGSGQPGGGGSGGFTGGQQGGGGYGS